MDKKIEQVLAEGEQQVVARIAGRDVTRGELSKAFDRVADKAHWKNPIDAHVIVCQAGELELIAKAIEFFTGSKAKVETVRVERTMTTYRVIAAGYFRTIGA